MAGINLGTAYLTVEPSTKGLAPALAAAWKNAQSSAKSAGDSAGQAYADAAGDTAERGISKSSKEIFKGASSSAGTEGTNAGRSFSDSAKGPISGIKTRIKSAFSGTKSESSKSGNIAGAAFQGSFLGALSANLVSKLTSSVTNVIGDALQGGIDRITSKQTATIMLRAGGMDEKSVQEAISAASAVAQGKAFSTGDIANVAAQLAPTGSLGEGQQMIDTLNTVANYATAAGKPVGDLGRIWASVAANGTLTGEDLMQLLDNGVNNVLPNLSKAMGVPLSDVKKLASEGKISFDTFQSAMAEGLDPAAMAEMQNTFPTAMTNLKSSVAQVGEAFLMAFTDGNLGETINGITEKIKGLKDGATKLGEWLKNNQGAVKVFAIVLGVLAVAITAVGIAFAVATVAATPMLLPILGITVAVGALIAGVVALWMNWDTVWAAIKGAAQAVGDWFVNTFGPIFSGIWEGIKTGLSSVGEFFTGIWDSIKSGLSAVGEFFSSVWEGIRFALAVVFGVIMTIVKDLFVDPWMERFNAIKDFFIGIWESITSFLEPIITWIVDFISERWETLKDGIEIVFAFIRNIIVNAWKAVSDLILPIIRGIVDWAVEKWTSLKDSVERIFNKVKTVASDVWNKIKTTITDVVDWIKDKVTEKFESLKDGVKNTIQKLKDGLTNIWNGIKNVFKDPINAVIRFINDPFITNINNMLEKFGLKDKKISKLREISAATGGVLPGYTPGRDVHDFYSPTGGLLHLSGGEAIMRPEWVRAVGGPDAIAYMNRQARSGRRTDYDGKRYASGGVFWPAGTRTVSGNYNGHTGVDIAGPIGTSIFSPTAGTISHVGWGRGFGYSIRETFLNGLSAVFGHLLPGSESVSVGQSVRPGQRIAGMDDTGNSTGSHLHFEVNSAGALGGAANRAGTLAFLNGAATSPSGEGGGWLDSFIGVITKPLAALKEMLSGSIVGDWLRSMSDTLVGYGKDLVTKPWKLFDDGGVLAPGLTMAVNKTNSPEAILTATQWSDISKVAAVGMSPKGTEIINPTYYVTVDADDLDDVQDVVNVFKKLSLEAVK